MIPFKLMQEKRNKMAVHQNVIITRKPPGAGLGRGSHSSRGLKRVEGKGSSSSIQTQCCQHSQSPAGSHNYLVFGWPSPLILAVIYLAPNWAWIHRSKWAGSIWKTDCTAANPQFSCLVSCTYLCWMYVDPPNEDSHVCSMWMKYTTVISNGLNCRFMIHSRSWRDLSMTVMAKLHKKIHSFQNNLRVKNN